MCMRAFKPNFGRTLQGTRSLVPRFSLSRVHQYTAHFPPHPSLQTMSVLAVTLLLSLASLANAMPSPPLAIGDVCVDSWRCASGRCDHTLNQCIKATHTTGKCLGNVDCTTANCNLGKCLASDIGGPCVKHTDCKSGGCDMLSAQCIATSCVRTCMNFLSFCLPPDEWV